MKKCEWEYGTCYQQVYTNYGKHNYCYWHRKVRAGLTDHETVNWEIDWNEEKINVK
jgi:hypothetical protein